jgi:hypothetical protein
MPLFKKKIAQAERPDNYVEQEPPETIDNPPTPPMEDMLAKVLANQQVIVQNQQVILNGVTATQELINKYATETDDDEPTDEEIREAIEQARKQKSKKDTVKKK